MSKRRARTAGRGEHYRRSAYALALTVAAFTACTGAQNGEGGDTGDVGTGGSGGSGGPAQGGAQPSGGSAGLAGGTGGIATGGASGASGASGTTSGTGGSNASGAGGSGAEATGGTTTGGSAGSDVGGAGTAGSGGTGGVATGGSGPGGTSSGGAAGDRCDVAVYNATTPPQIVAVTNPPSTHDPVVIESAGTLYLFHTGNNVGARTSTNLLAWASASALSSTPAWTNTYTSRDGDLWAPDISYFGGQYHLYYSASSFGQNSSCIGHATRAALNAGSWADQGQVICTTTSNNYNAIDPNVIVDQAGAPWLAFGSFWDGIMMIPLDMMGARMGTAAPMNIAQRMAPEKPIEAPFIVRRCGYYYLFVSWDKCCQGASSTYNIRVGRSAAVTGPYVDKAGLPMLNTNRQATDGGTLVVQADARWKGPGHNAILFRGNVAYNIYHSYDANNAGRITLRISEIAWDAEGWPISAGP